MSFVAAPRFQLGLALVLLAGAAWIARIAWRKMRDARIVHSPIFGKLWIVPTQPQPLLLSLCQSDDGVRFQVRAALGKPPRPDNVTLLTLRADGLGQRFELVDRRTYLESKTTVPEPHVFIARLSCLPDPRDHDIEIEALDVHHALDVSLPQPPRAERTARGLGAWRPELDALKAGVVLAVSTLAGMLSLALATASLQAMLSD